MFLHITGHRNVYTIIIWSIAPLSLAEIKKQVPLSRGKKTSAKPMPDTPTPTMINVNYDHTRCVSSASKLPDYGILSLTHQSMNIPTKQFVGLPGCVSSCLSFSVYLLILGLSITVAMRPDIPPTRWTPPEPVGKSYRKWAVLSDSLFCKGNTQLYLSQLDGDLSWSIVIYQYTLSSYKQTDKQTDRVLAVLSFARLWTAFAIQLHDTPYDIDSPQTFG